MILEKGDVVKYINSLCLVFWITIVGLSSNAAAATVVIDPGDGGTSFKEKVFVFDDFNGESAEALGALEFVFADEKFGTVVLRDDAMLIADLTFTFSDTASGFVSVTNGSLRDGDNLLASEDSGSSGGGNSDTFNVRWYDWNDPLIDGFKFSSVYFNSIRFRDYPESATIVSATLKLYVWGAVHDGTVEIGSTSSFPWNLFLPAILEAGRQ